MIDGGNTGHSQVIDHCGVKLPFTSNRIWVCSNCGSDKIRQARTDDYDAHCLTCGFGGKPVLQSVFAAAQLRENA